MKTPFSSSVFGRVLDHRLLVLFAGASTALGLSRYLYHSSLLPAAQALGNWPATLALSVAGAALAAILYRVLTVFLSRDTPPATGPGFELAATFLPGLLPLADVLAPDVNLLRAKVLMLGAVAGFLALLIRLFARRELEEVPQKQTMKNPFSSSVFGIASFCIPALIIFGLYLRTMAPTVGEADSFEFQVDIARLAVAHPSGYPLFILLGKAFTLLPLGGTLAYRANLASATFGVLAGLLGFFSMRRLGADRLISGLTTLLIGVSPTLWSRSVEAEVYSLHAALVAALLWLMLSLTETYTRVPVDRYTSKQVDRSRRVYVFTCVLVYLFGLSLTNHVTTILLAPAILLTLAISRPGLALRQWPGAVGLFLLGLSVYLYLPLRWPAVNDGEIMTPPMFIEYITGSQSQGALRLDAFITDLSRYSILARKSLGEFGWPGALLALTGLIYLAMRNRRAAGITLLAYLGLAFFPLSFYVPDPDFSAFLIGPHLIQAVWIGMGVHGAHKMLNAECRMQNSAFCVLHSALATSFFLLPLFLIWRNLPRVDKSDQWQAHNLGRFILEQPLEAGALVLADSQKIAPLYYLQIAEGLRPDLDIRVLPDEAAYRQALEVGLAAGQTVYLGRYLPGLAGALHLRSVGPLVEPSFTPLLDPPSMTPVGADFGGQITLLGFQFSTPVGSNDPAERPREGPRFLRGSGAEGVSHSISVTPGYLLPLTFYWEPASAPDGNYLVRLRLVPEPGMAIPAHEPVWSAPPRVPAGGMNPTLAWTPGEVIPDFHFVTVPPTVLPGDYVLQVGIFQPFSETGLAVAGGSWLSITSVRVAPALNDPRPAPAAHFRFSDGLTLVGYDLPETVAPSAQVPLTLYWRASGIPDIPPALALGGYLDGKEQPLLHAPLPVAQWPPGRIVAAAYAFTAPHETGELRLRLALPPASVRCGWLRPLTTHCALPSLRVTGAAIGPDAVSFDNQILLTSFRLEAPTAGPGGSVRVTMEWQGLRTMIEDYTLFVHLIGPDGLVHGQIDTWPGQGTRPTSGWSPDEPFSDTYEIQVPADAPEGEYSIEIGWYLLATLDRLAVRGEDGQAVDDKFLRSGLTIHADIKTPP